jgi:hypothetical protein
MMKESDVMICLVGEQPLPNLLPIRHFQPRRVVLVSTRTTEKISQNLEALLKDQFEIGTVNVPAYDILAAQGILGKALAQYSPQTQHMIFNVTGGTKPMSLAAFRVAEKLGARVIYLESEGGRSILHHYGFSGRDLAPEEPVTIGELITIDDYLKAHGLGAYQQRPIREPFERLVFESLEPHVSEILPCVSIDALEIDLMIRLSNQVGIAEVKSGKAAERKNGIDQLSTASQREYLGTYTKRFLIVDRNPGTNNQKLAEAHRIRVIPLLGDHNAGLSEQEVRKLGETVTQALGRARKHDRNTNP